MTERSNELYQRLTNDELKSRLEDVIIRKERTEIRNAIAQSEYWNKRIKALNTEISLIRQLLKEEEIEP